jgi:hypothetical protein
MSPVLKRQYDSEYLDKMANFLDEKSKVFTCIYCYSSR